MVVETNMKMAHQLLIRLVQTPILKAQQLKLLGAWKILLVRKKAHAELWYLPYLMQSQPQLPDRSEDVPMDKQYSSKME